MSPAVTTILVGLVPFAALMAFWSYSRLNTRLTAGFQLAWPLAAGAVESTSGWGSAQVNGHQLGTISVSGECVRLLKCQNGYIVQLRWIFGGGYIFLPRDELRVARCAPQGVLQRQCRALSTTNRQVVVYGRLAEFVE